jgi:hypothetical protein
MRRHEPNLSGLGWGQVAGCCEHENEPLGLVQYREFFDWLRISKLLKKFSAPFTLLTFCCLALGFTACWGMGIRNQFPAGPEILLFTLIQNPVAAILSAFLKTSPKVHLVSSTVGTGSLYLG